MLGFRIRHGAIGPACAHPVRLGSPILRMRGAVRGPPHNSPEPSPQVLASDGWRPEGERRNGRESVSDSMSACEARTAVNERTTRSFIAILAWAAILALWAELLLSVPHYGNLADEGGPPSFVAALIVWPFIFIVILLVTLRVTTEWTVLDGELHRRGWLSRPGCQPRLAARLEGSAQIVHESRTRWRLWPEGLAIHCWPGQTSRLVSAMKRAGVAVDDFRGEWELSHRRLGGLAMLSYGAGLAILGITPILGLVVGSGLPLLPVVGGAALIGLGRAIDSQPWKATRPDARTGYLRK